jgi:hypothetical protein
MRFTRANTDSQARRSAEGGQARGISLVAEASSGHTHMRSEPQTLRSRPVPRDPYALWLAQQQSVREQARVEETRWVYRYPRVTRSAAPAAGPSRPEPARTGALAASGGLR